MEGRRERERVREIKDERARRNELCVLGKVNKRQQRRAVLSLLAEAFHIRFFLFSTR